MRADEGKDNGGKDMREDWLLSAAFRTIMATISSWERRKNDWHQELIITIIIIVYVINIDTLYIYIYIFL